MPDDSNASEVNHVYILGAGFSRPMGGPLFKEIFSPHYNRIVPEIDFKVNRDGWILARVARELAYVYERLEKETNSADAERFLELCDYSHLPQNSWFLESFIKQLPWIRSAYIDSGLPDSDSEFGYDCINGTRIRLGLESNHFLRCVPEDSERWIPYDRWFRGLGKNDTIVTLNYDLLVETVASRGKRAFPGGELKTRDDLLLVDELLNQNENHSDLPMLFKLHGSVDWIELQGKALVKRYNVDDYFHGQPPLLGTPGTMKARLSKGCLDKVWGSAIEKIKEAHVISIVGYSLPETDNDFRIKLLDSIIGTYGNLKAINIVLGPATPHSQRARAILEQATRQFAPDDHRPTVNLLPIYAQDYLPYYMPKKISHIDKHAFRGV
jgi:hypothetical protein